MSAFEQPPAKRHKSEAAAVAITAAVSAVPVTEAHLIDRHETHDSASRVSQLARRNSTFGGRLRRRGSISETPRPLKPTQTPEEGLGVSPRPTLGLGAGANDDLLNKNNGRGAAYVDAAGAVATPGGGYSDARFFPQSGTTNVSHASVVTGQADNMTTNVNSGGQQDGSESCVLRSPNISPKTAENSVPLSESDVSGTTAARAAQASAASAPSSSSVPSAPPSSSSSSHSSTPAPGAAVPNDYDTNIQRPRMLDEPAYLARLPGWSGLPARYTPLEVIGEGSYGKVCLADDGIMGEQVAIKKVVDVFCNTGDARRILREIKILRNLRHDNIIPIMDIITPTDENNFEDLYIVFARMDCDMLRIINDTSQQLEDAHIVTFMRQMLKALMYMHNSQVIHRDIKPGNILLTEDCSLRICDFGLARGFNEVDNGGRAAASPTKASAAGRKPPKLQRQMTQHVATRWYRAPELILQRRYTQAIDVWSVGCIFGELLSMKEANNQRDPMFPGGSCMPWSPGHNASVGHGAKNSQLNVIYNVIGTPSRDVLKKMGLGASEIDSFLQASRKPENLAERFPKATPESLDLLTKMLMFDPEERISIPDALSHGYLNGDGGRVSPTTPGVGASAHSMETGVSIDFSFEERATSIPSIRRMILEECAWYRSVWRKALADAEAGGTAASAGSGELL